MGGTYVFATINGQETELPENSTVGSFLANRQLHPRMVVVELNGEILKRDDFDATVIQSEDVVEIVHFVGGG